MHGEPLTSMGERGREGWVVEGGGLGRRHGGGRGGGGHVAGVCAAVGELEGEGIVV